MTAGFRTGSALDSLCGWASYSSFLSLSFSWRVGTRTLNSGVGRIKSSAQHVVEAPYTGPQCPIVYVWKALQLTEDFALFYVL